MVISSISMPASLSTPKTSSNRYSYSISKKTMGTTSAPSTSAPSTASTAQKSTTPATTTSQKSYSYTRSDGSVGTTTDYRHSDAGKAASAMNQAAAGTMSTSTAQTYVDRAAKSGGISSSTASSYSSALSSGVEGLRGTSSASLGTATPSALNTNSQVNTIKDGSGRTIATIQPVYVSGAGTSTTYHYTTTDGKGYQFGLGGAVSFRQAAEDFLERAKKALKAGDKKKYEENLGSANLFGLAAAYEEQSDFREKYGSATGITYDAFNSMIYDGDINGTYGQSVWLKEGEKAPTGTVSFGDTADSWKVGDVDGKHTAVSALEERTVESILNFKSNDIKPGEEGSPQNPILAGYEGYVLQNPSGTTGNGSDPIPSDVLMKAGSDTVDKYIAWTEDSIGVDENGNLTVNDPAGLAVSILTPDMLVKVTKRIADGRADELDVGDYALAGLDLLGFVPVIGWAAKGLGKAIKAGMKVAGKAALNTATSKPVLKAAGNVGEKLGANTETSVIKLGSNAEEGLTKLGGKVADATESFAKTTKTLAPLTAAASLGGQAAVVGYYATQADGDPDTPTPDPKQNGDTTLPETPYGVTNYYENTYFIGGSDSPMGGYDQGGSGGSSGGGGVVQTASSEASDLFSTYGPYIIPVMLVVVGLILLTKKNKSSKKTGVTA